MKVVKQDKAHKKMAAAFTIITGIAYMEGRKGMSIKSVLQHIPPPQRKTVRSAMWISGTEDRRGTKTGVEGAHLRWE